MVSSNVALTVYFALDIAESAVLSSNTQRIFIEVRTNLDLPGSLGGFAGLDLLDGLGSFGDLDPPDGLRRLLGASNLALRQLGTHLAHLGLGKGHLRPRFGLSSARLGFGFGLGLGHARFSFDHRRFRGSVFSAVGACKLLPRGLLMITHTLPLSSSYIREIYFN